MFNYTLYGILIKNFKQITPYRVYFRYITLQLSRKGVI